MWSRHPVSSPTFWSSCCPWAGPWTWDVTQGGQGTSIPVGPSTPAQTAMTRNKLVIYWQTSPVDWRRIVQNACQHVSACWVIKSMLNFFGCRGSSYSRGHRRFSLQWGEEGFVLCRCSDRDSLRRSIFHRKFWSAFASFTVN